jgi:signal transduction histidine kinase
LADSPVLNQLESEVDQLHRALEEQQAGEAERLQALKLNALAELAAGAGHEINNPLAVISGQAQYLLKQMQSAECRMQNDTQDGAPPEVAQPQVSYQPAAINHSLQKIVKQAQRIHELLNELMQFARPPRPQKQPVDVGGLVHEVAGALTDYALQRRVQLHCAEPGHALRLHADPRHLRTILSCLLRNAIEAASREAETRRLDEVAAQQPAGTAPTPEGFVGWAAIRVEVPTVERVNLIVEDSGPGPAPAQVEHLFDPFYSGRHAGRGRGLGLSTAWRLAREHGGNVYFDAQGGGPTRFVLSLPREAPGCTLPDSLGNSLTA